MTKDQAMRWLAAVQCVEGLLKGAIDRKTPSDKLRSSVLAYLKPIVADMEAAAPKKIKRERL